MRRVTFYASIVATTAFGLGAVLIACGGSTDDQSAIVAPAREDAGNGSSGATSSSGAAGNDGGGTNDAGNPNDSGSGNDGGGSSGTPTPNAVQCGSATCNTASQQCCVTVQQGQQPEFNCIANGSNCQGIDQRCDDKADCPANQVCCANISGFNISATCQATCNGPNSYQMCKAANECVSGSCTTMTCGPTTLQMCQKPGFCQ